MNSRLLIAICVMIVVVALCQVAESQRYGGGGRHGGNRYGGGQYGGGGYGGGGYGGGGSRPNPNYGRPYDSDGYYIGG